MSANQTPVQQEDSPLEAIDGSDSASEHSEQEPATGEDESGPENFEDESAPEDSEQELVSCEGDFAEEDPEEEPSTIEAEW